MTHYRNVSIEGLNVFYREAGEVDLPCLVLLHGFPSSSHMFRDLIPQLASRFHVIAPDYIGFGYSAAPPVNQFQYTFENITAIVEKLLFAKLNLKSFSIYVQDYGAPVGFRLAYLHQDAIEGIIVQNGNAYAEGISAAFDPLKPFWATRSAETEVPVRSLLAAGTTVFQYTHGVADVETISPDSYTFDQHFLDRPGNDAIQLDLFHDYPSNVGVYEEWHRYFREKQPRTLIVWGQKDPFFTVDGAKAFLRDLPSAELHLLNTGHFALEDHCDFIAMKIHEFFARQTRKAA